MPSWATTQRAEKRKREEKRNSEQKPGNDSGES